MEHKITRHLLWFVPLKPVAQKRHRHTKGGRTYDPSAPEKVIFRRRSVELCKASIDTNPMLMKLVFSCERPCSHYTTKERKRLTKRAPMQHVFKPDIDNYCKFVMDALCGTYYKDDSQIFSVHAEKKWVAAGEGGIRVELISVDHLAC